MAVYTAAADRKLLLLIRHGQAISNYLGDTLGPDEWFAVEGTCQYDDGKGTIWNIFDAGELAVTSSLSAPACSSTCLSFEYWTAKGANPRMPFLWLALAGL